MPRATESGVVQRRLLFRCRGEEVELQHGSLSPDRLARSDDVVRILGYPVSLIDAGSFHSDVPTIEFTGAGRDVLFTE